MRKFLCVFISFLVAITVFITLFVFTVRHYPFSWEYSDHIVCILGVLFALTTIAAFVAYLSMNFLEKKLLKKTDL